MRQVLAGLSITLAILMVSKVNYDALPKPTADSFRQHPVQMSLYIVALFAVLLFHAKAFFLAMLLYILLGVVRSIALSWRRVWQA
jgi:CDP-diacylglycerol--serine O-phosphatidyltransferase